MPPKKKTEDESTEEDEAAEWTEGLLAGAKAGLQVLGVVTEAVSDPSTPSLQEQVDSLKGQVDDLKDRLRTHYRAHHKFESSVSNF